MIWIRNYLSIVHENWSEKKRGGEKDKEKERSGKHIQIKIKSGNRIKIWDREGKEKRKIGRHIK